MSWILNESGTSPGTILNVVEFDNIANCFTLSNSSGEVKITIPYIPISSSNWNPVDFDIVILENNYLNAENDVFEVYDSELSERIGWIFPLTVLESNNNDYVNVKNLNKYKHIAYYKLFEKNALVEVTPNENGNYKLWDIFGDVIICILNKTVTNKVVNYKFDNYILSLYNYGYLVKNDNIKFKKVYDRPDLIREMRQSGKRVTLKKAKFDITKSLYISTLFKNHLLQSENHIVRFIFLYQIIEHLMQLEYENQLHSYLNDYLKNHIAKNEMREAINEISKERDLVRKIVNTLSIPAQIKNDFIQECNFLFNDIKHKTKDTLGDKLYDLRNVVIHRLRDLTLSDKSLLPLIALFETLIVEILITYKPNSSNNALLRVNSMLTNNDMAKKIKSISKTRQKNLGKSRRR